MALNHCIKTDIPCQWKDVSRRLQMLIIIIIIISSSSSSSSSISIVLDSL